MPPFAITPKDLIVLETLTDDARIPPALRELLARKLSRCGVIAADAIPPTFATLNSRVRYRLNDGRQEMDTLSSQLAGPGLGLFLPLNTTRAIALIGLREGQQFPFRNDNGADQTVTLDEVCYQPEDVRRQRCRT